MSHFAHHSGSGGSHSPMSQHLSSSVMAAAMQQQLLHQQSQQHLQSLHQNPNHHTNQQQDNPNNQSNSSTPSSNTSFLIKDILRYDGQKRKQRKARTAFSDHQLKELESSFETKRYLTVQDRMELANRLKLSDTQVKTWYQNRRTKFKRQTAVGVELLSEMSHFQAYQSVLQQPGAQWLLSQCSFPGAQLNIAAAAAAVLSAQAQAQAQAQAAQVHAANLGAHLVTSAASTPPQIATSQHQQQQQQHHHQAASHSNATGNSTPPIHHNHNHNSNSSSNDHSPQPPHLDHKLLLDK